MHIFNKHIAMTVVLILFLFALVTMTPTTFAQQVPNIGGAMKQAAPPPKETPAKKETPSVPVIIQEEEKPFSLPEGEKIFIKDFKIEGAGKADENDLTALLAPVSYTHLTLPTIYSV
jgi:hypothetical protein